MPDYGSEEERVNAFCIACDSGRPSTAYAAGEDIVDLCDPCRAEMLAAWEAMTPEEQAVVMQDVSYG